MFATTIRARLAIGAVALSLTLAAVGASLAVAPERASAAGPSAAAAAKAHAGKGQAGKARGVVRQSRRGRALTRRIVRLGASYRRADRRLVREARRLRACRAAGRACSTRRLQAAGRRLAKVRTRLRAVDRRTRKRGAAATVRPPRISVKGAVLSWNSVTRSRSYVFVRKVPGLPDEYSTVRGTRVQPPAVPGKTVRYSVRAAVAGSAWAREVAISYPRSSAPRQAPAPTPKPRPAPAPQPVAAPKPQPVTAPAPSPAPEPTPQPAPTPAPQPEPAKPIDRKAAPALWVDGHTVRWEKVAGVDTYVFVRKVPGQRDAYSSVTGTSVTPPAAPGKAVRFSVRTAVDGSVWAPEVSISYPEEESSAPVPAPAPAPAPTPEPVASGPFTMGIVAGSALSYELSFLQQLGARTARLEFGIETPAASMATVIDQYARAGIRPLLLAGFHGRLPSEAEARNLGSWAAAYGPGGSFWQGKSYPPNTAVTAIEFGNETSYSYQFADNSQSTYAARARTYALRAKLAHESIVAANPGVGILVNGDNAVNQNSWMTNMLAAVPDLGHRALGWTIHPYGLSWQSRMDRTLDSARAGGAPDRPLWITEWGLATDDGRCLDDNYGHDKCMSYSQAAATFTSTLSAMRARYGSKLAAFYLFQAHDQRATGSSNGREHYFGALQQYGESKGEFTAVVKAALAANP